MKFDDTSLTLPEKIIEYMIISNELKGKSLFVTVDLRNYLTDKQAEELFKSIVLKKYHVICIEGAEHERLSNEEVIIIDKDMCVI